ncbi:MFS transporter [Streptomyces blattellae]|uniref:MFS transporter n=1 Tax=Streptomyces blattellae TaxID=2569855 RepID=UPI0012B704B4|nr:MFS transporter [Streptomyces blattellae]
MSVETTPSKGQDRVLANEPSKGTLIAACLAVCLAQGALFTTNTTNEILQASLQPVGSQLSWVSNSFLVPVVMLALTFGMLGDRFGRKRLLVGGALVVVVGETVAAAGDGIHQLWVGQAITGVGAAALFPASLALITAGSGSARGRAMLLSLWTAALGAGGFVALGVTRVGDVQSWNWSFSLLAVLAGVSVVVSQLLAQDSKASEGRSLDLAGQITIAVGMFALVYALVEGAAHTWSETRVVVGFIAAAVFVGLFVVVELRTENPLLPLRLFASRAFTVSSFVAVVALFGFSGTVYAVIVRVRSVQGQAASHAGFAFTVLVAFTLLLVPVTARLLARAGSRWPLCAGLLLMASGYFIAASLDINDTSLTPIILAVVPVGIGFALTIASVTNMAVDAGPARDAGTLAASTSMLRMLGFALGPVVTGAIAMRLATSQITTDLAASSLPAETKGAVAGVLDASGPLAVNAIPTPPVNAAHDIAFEALGSGLSQGLVVCGIATLVACALVAVVKTGSGGPGAVAEQTAAAPEPGQATV